MDPAATRMKPAGAATASASRSWWMRRLLMYSFAVACLAWVFHDIHPRQLLASMIIANPWFLAAAVVADVLTYVLQGVRWKLLLAPVGRLSSIRATQAIYAGLFTNEVVPLRFGELVRGFLVSRWLSSSMTAVVPSMVVERFLDALCLASGIGLTALSVPLPRDLIDAADILGAIILAATATFLWIVFRKEKELEAGSAPVTPSDTRAGSSETDFGSMHTRSESGEQQSKISGSRVLAAVPRFVSRVASGLREIGMSPRLYFAALLSGAMLMCQAMAVWFMLLACGIRLPLGAGIVVFLVVRIGTAIPNAPANVGSFQFFTVLALGLFGVDKTLAAAFSILDFAVLTAPLWIIGLFAVTRTGMKLADIRIKVSSLGSRIAS